MDTEEILVKKNEREEIEKLCQMYRVKMKENEVAMESIECENKEMLKVLKNKCEGEDEIEENLNIDDMVKMISDLELDNSKKEEEIEQLKVDLRCSLNNVEEKKKLLSLAKVEVDVLSASVEKHKISETQRITLLEKAEHEITDLKNTIEKVRNEKTVCEEEFKAESERLVNEMKAIKHELDKNTKENSRIQRSSIEDKVAKNVDLKTKKTQKESDLKTKETRRLPEKRKSDPERLGKKPSFVTRRNTPDSTSLYKNRSKSKSTDNIARNAVLEERIFGLTVELEQAKRNCETHAKEQQEERKSIDVLKHDILLKERIFADQIEKLQRENLVKTEQLDDLKAKEAQEICEWKGKYFAANKDLEVLTVKSNELSKLNGDLMLHVDKLKNQHECSLRELTMDCESTERNLKEELERVKEKLCDNNNVIKNLQIDLKKKEIELKDVYENLQSLEAESELHAKDTLQREEEDANSIELLKRSRNEMKILQECFNEQKITIGDLKFQITSFEEEKVSMARIWENKITELKSDWQRYYESRFNEEMRECKISHGKELKNMESKIFEVASRENLEKQLRQVKQQLEEKQTCLRNVQMQLDYQVNVGEFMMKTLQQELNKQSANREILKILSNLSQQFDAVFSESKLLTSNSFAQEESLYDSENNSCSLSGFVGATNHESYRKSEVEVKQRKVNAQLKILRLFVERRPPSIASLCQAGESALSPPLRMERPQSSGSFIESDVNDSGVEMAYSKYSRVRMIENLLSEVRIDVSCMEKNSANLPLFWLDDVNKWVRICLDELNYLKDKEDRFNEQTNDVNNARKSSVPIMYRPSREEVTSIIDRVNRSYAEANQIRMWKT